MNKLILLLTIMFSLTDLKAETDFSKIQFVFLNASESASFLQQRDDYTDILSPLDLSLYHSTKETISIEEHLEFLKSTPMEWSEGEKLSLLEKMESFKAVVTTLNLSLSLPEKIVLIKTNGEDAFRSHYTRRNGIIFPAAPNGFITTDLATFYHEMFHILSRHSPDLADRLFPLIGFSRISRVSLPKDLEQIRTTNPDAFFYDHAVSVMARNSEHAVIPFMYSAIKKEEINGPVDESLVYKLGLLDLATINDQRPVLFKVSETNYKDVVKANSHYYIHPEEILAEDFKLLLLKNTPNVEAPVIKFPDVLDQMKTRLK